MLDHQHGTPDQLGVSIFMGESERRCAVPGIGGPNHIVSERLWHQSFPAWSAHVAVAELWDCLSLGESVRYCFFQPSGTIGAEREG